MTTFSKLIATMLMMLALPAYGATPDWAVSEMSGSATVTRAQGTATKAARGTTLKQGDTLSTGAKSRVVLVRKQEFITISANSRLTVSPQKSGSMVQILQKNGSAIYKIQKKTAPHFAVETPYLAAVVKGTTFIVNVNGSGASVQVTEGRVQVVANKGGAEHLLTAGKIGLIDAKSPGTLTVQGDGPDFNVQGNAAATSATEPAASAVNEPETTEQEDSAINQDVVEDEVKLDDLTDGLIAGDSSLRGVTVALASDKDTPAPPSGDSGSAGGSDSGDADSGNGGKDGGNGDTDTGKGGGDDGGKNDDDDGDKDDGDDGDKGGKDDDDDGDKGDDDKDGKDKGGKKDD